MSDNTKHLAKKCVKDAGPCLALCLAGVGVAVLAVLGPFGVLRSASFLHVCMALAGAMMTGGVLDLVFWVLDPFGWENEGLSPKGWKGWNGWNGWLSDRAECGLATCREVVIR